MSNDVGGEFLVNEYLIVHYQHNTWVKTLKENEVFQSMSRKATCADNASMENFFGILKQEMYYGEKLMTYEALKNEIGRFKPSAIPDSNQPPNSCIIKTLTLWGHHLTN